MTNPQIYEAWDERPIVMLALCATGELTMVVN